MTALNCLTPLQTGEIDPSDWSGRWPLLAKVAVAGNKRLPRGKGVFPRWIGRTFGENWKLVVTTQSGCRIAVDPSNLDLYAAIANEGLWEPWIRNACIQALRPNDVFFDVGANAGCISNEIALARPNVTIKAFEPQPNLAPLIVLSAALNNCDSIEVFQVAVGESSGVIELHVPAHALHASLKPSSQGGDRVVESQIISLDEAVIQYRLPAPNLIKIDVEGAEFGVLKGARRTLQTHRPIVIFEANDNCERFGYAREDLFAEISSAGKYCFFKVSPGDTLAAPEERADEFVSHYSQIES